MMREAGYRGGPVTESSMTLQRLWARNSVENAWKIQNEDLMRGQATLRSEI